MPTRLIRYVFALVAALVLMPILFLVLLILTTSAVVASFQNSGKVKDIRATTQKAKSIISVYQTRDRELFNYAPVLQKRKRTMDVLNILKFQQDMVVASTNQMWFLLLADKHTYTQGSPSLDNHTNTVLKMGDVEEFSLGKYTYISELCLLTNRGPDPQKLFLTTVRDEMTNLFFIDYADTLLPGFFNTNFIDPKYLVGGDRFGTIFTTKGFLSKNSVYKFSKPTTAKYLYKADDKRTDIFKDSKIYFCFVPSAVTLFIFVFIPLLDRNKRLDEEVQESYRELMELNYNSPTRC